MVSVMEGYFKQLKISAARCQILFILRTDIVSPAGAANPFFCAALVVILSNGNVSHSCASHYQGKGEGTGVSSAASVLFVMFSKAKLDFVIALEQPENLISLPQRFYAVVRRRCIERILACDSAWEPLNIHRLSTAKEQGVELAINEQWRTKEYASGCLEGLPMASDAYS